MTYNNDIKSKIESDFGDLSSEVFKIINDAITTTEYLNHERIIRCIIFLADKDIEKLKHYISIAIQDPRDVMFWAEYINRDAEQTPKRVRDFNKSFDMCEVDVKE